MTRPLAADFLRDDPRLEAGRRLMLSALADQQQRLTGIRAADPERKLEYETAIRQFGELRGGELYYPYLGSGIGRGALVELADGSVKYDMISGIGVHYFGHGASTVVAAALDAALCDIVMQGNLQQDRETLGMTRLLTELASRDGARLSHCLLTTSGAMANENALKIALQKKHPASRVLAFEHGFAGRTLALAQITDKAAYRVGLPTTLAVDYVPYFDADRPAESTAAAIAVLRQHLARYPRQHAVMVVELVQGEGGYYAGDRDFFLALLRELRNAGIAIFFDEVQTFGRTTQPFAFQHFGLDEFADLVSIGKLSQLCATLFTHEYQPKPGLVSQTFTAATASLFTGRAIIGALASGDYFGPTGRIQQVHDRFVSRLQEIGRRHPDSIRGPWGLGAMIAFTPFGGSADTVKGLLRALFDEGVIAFLAGSNPTRIRLLPPVGVITDADIDQVCEVVGTVMGKRSLGREASSE